MAEKTFWMEENRWTDTGAFPEFMNDGYAPPDWSVLESLAESWPEDESQIDSAPLRRRYDD